MADDVDVSDATQDGVLGNQAPVDVPVGGDGAPPQDVGSWVDQQATATGARNANRYLENGSEQGSFDEAWDTVAGNLRRQFPNVADDQVQAMQNRYYVGRDEAFHQQAINRFGQYNLEAAHDIPEGITRVARGLLKNALPFNDALYGAYDESEMHAAQERVNQGQATADDYSILGRFAAQRVRDQTDNTQHFGRFGGLAASALESAVPVAEEQYVMNGLLPGLGEGASYLLRAGRFAATVLGSPSLWVGEAKQNAERNGGDWYDLSNMSPALIHAGVTTAVLGTFGKMVKGAESPTASQFLTTLASRAGVGMAEQEGADVAGTAIDRTVQQITGHSIGLDTGYGTIGTFINKGPEEGFNQLFGRAVTFLAFSAMHGGSAGTQEGGETEPNGAQRGLPGDVTPPHPAVQAFVDAANWLKKTRGYSHDRAVDALREAGDPIYNAWQRNPNMTRDQAHYIIRDMPDSPLRDFARALADSLPDNSAPQAIGHSETPEATPPEAPQTPPETQEAQSGAQEAPAAAPEAPQGQESPLFDNAGDFEPGEGQGSPLSQDDTHAIFGDMLQNGETVGPKSEPVRGPVNPLDLFEGERQAERRQVAQEGPRERRTDAERRKTVAEMSPDEMRHELFVARLEDEHGNVTELPIPNARAFQEAEMASPAPVKGMSDADGLKAFNDRFGYEAGNKLLVAKAESLKEAKIDAYHQKGDEFIYRGDDDGELRSKLERARTLLREKHITVKMKDGSVKTFKGADFSYGVGNDLKAGKSGQDQHKAEREARGERARGELRGIVEVRPVESGVGVSGVNSERAGETQSEGPSVESPPFDVNKAPLTARVKENARRKKMGLAPLVPDRAGPHPMEAIRDRFDAGENVSSKEIYDAVGLTERERLVVDQIKMGTPLDEVGGKIGLTKSRAQQISMELATKFDDKFNNRDLAKEFLNTLRKGDRESVKSATTADGKKVDVLPENMEAKVLEARNSPEAKAKTRKAKAKLSEAEKIDSQITLLGKQYIREFKEYAKKGGMSDERRQFYESEARRLDEHLRQSAKGVESASSDVEGEPVSVDDNGPGTDVAPVPEGPGSAQDVTSPSGQGTQDSSSAESPALPETAGPGADTGSRGQDSAADPAAPQEQPVRKLTPGERLARSKGWAKAATERAKEAGFSPQEIDGIHQHAQQLFKDGKERFNQENEILKDAWSELKSHGINYQNFRSRFADKDATNVKGIDEVADDIFRRYGIEVDSNEHADDKLFRMLMDGATQMTMREAYSEAFRDYEASKAQEDERRELEKAGRSAGLSTQKVHADLEGIEGQARGESSEGEGKAPAVRDEVGSGSGDEPPNEPYDTIPHDDWDAPSGPITDPDRPLGDRAWDIARDFVKDEGGYLNLQMMHDAAVAIKDHLVSATKHISDNLAEFAGKMGPRTTALDRRSGEALARFNAAKTFTREAIPYYIDKVMGKGAMPAARLRVGAVLTEMRLQHMKQVFMGNGNIKAANAVQSIIGAPNSPLKTMADFTASMNHPKVREVLNRYIREFVPEMDTQFRKAKGLAPTDPLNVETQIPGMPINLKRVDAGQTVTPSTVFVGGGGRGNLKNPQVRKGVFTNRATGAADAYDIDLGAIMENSLARSVEDGAKAELVRTMVDSGIASWDRPGQKVTVRGEQGKEVPGVNPHPGTQVAQRGETSLYVHPDAYDELRRALAPDRPNNLESLAAFNSIITKAALSSTMEMTAHTKNLLTFLTKPGVRISDFMLNSYKMWAKDPEIATRLVELARIGALKDPGLETGATISPLKWTGKALDLLGRLMRLTGEDAFERMKRSGRVVGTETNKRDFINQLGQYNVKAQQKIIALLRDTGLGPFATAGSNYYMQGIYSILGKPGVQATSGRAAIRLRAEMYGKMAAVLGAVALVNYLLWKRVDGSDSTPLGAIKVGEKDGKVQYLDMANLIGLTRGMRSTGLMALAEGARSGNKPATIADNATQDAIHGLMHPMLGPTPAFLWTTATGENTLGARVAEHAPPGGSQAWLNLKAAITNANPAVGALTGSNRPGQQVPLAERVNQLAGPFGVHYRREMSHAARNAMEESMRRRGLR